jgi:FkbM family methyltransferase
LKIRRTAGKYLRKLLGFERFTFYKALRNLKKLKITDKEEEDFFYFLSLLKEDFNVLDIGANVGIMTTLMARKAVNGKVFSFEPVPVTFKVLERMIKQNKLNNVKIFDMAVGNENVIVHMNMPVFDDIVSDAGSYVMQDHYYFNNTNVVKVDVKQITVDTLGDLSGININAIKIDIENYEYFALSGASKLLLEQRPIIFSEIWYGSENQKKVFNLMTELGYSILIYEGKKLVSFDPVTHNKLNYFFIPNEKVNSLEKPQDHTQ